MEDLKNRSKSQVLVTFNEAPFITDADSDYYDVEITDSNSWLKKVMNSMRHKWNSFTPAALFSRDSTTDVFLLGEKFENSESTRFKSFNDFSKRLNSILWITYRSNFRPFLLNSGRKMTSDTGWGCTIRVGQMMLLLTLKKHFEVDSDFFTAQEKKVQILKLVEENLLSAPFSIHSIISFGGIRKGPGDQFSPNDICSALIRLQEKFPIPGIVFVLCLDYQINQLEIYSKACQVPESLVKSCRNSLPLYGSPGTNELHWKKSIFLMVPLMLGLKNIEEKFVETLKFFVSLRFTTGVIVDKSGSALFMVGFSGNLAITLDPHVVKRANRNLDELKKREGETRSEYVALVNLKELGPSVAVGFYLRDEIDFAEFVEVLAGNNEVVQGLVVLAAGDENEQVFGESDEEDFMVL
jgi:cysteine protease ATG4